jgi:hypothetical protein
MASISISNRSSGRRRRGLVGKLVGSSIIAAVASCGIAALAGTAQAAPAPALPTIGWQLTHPFCAACTGAVDGTQWIDPAGALAPGARLQIVLKGTIQGKPAAGAMVFLSDRLAGPGATATVAGNALTPVPQPFVLNAAGKLSVTYRVANVPAGPIGTDVLMAAVTPQNKSPVTASYNYDPPAAYVLAPVPVAPAGSLAAGQSAPAQLVAIDAAGQAVGGAFVGDSEDNFCGTWWPIGPHHLGPQVGPAANPTYAFTNAAGQLNFTFISNGTAGGVNVLNVFGAAAGQAGPGAATSYQC